MFNNKKVVIEDIVSVRTNIQDNLRKREEMMEGKGKEEGRRREKKPGASCLCPSQEVFPAPEALVFPLPSQGTLNTML